MMETRVLSRRTALKGLGLSVALPWFESLQPARVLAASKAAAPPVRMACLFVPNGVNMDYWTPQQQGFGFDLPSILEPLARVQDDLLVFTGLTHDKGWANGDGAGDHARSASVFLTGAQPRKTSGAEIRSGVSVDQVAAQAVGRATKFPSIELGCEAGRGAGNCDSGYSCAYSSNISWASESSPMGKEVNPRLAFERLFASGSATAVGESQKRRRALQKSILDYVAADAERLQRSLGQQDQRKLDEYLTGVREIEQRIDRFAVAPQVETQLGLKVPQETPDDYAEHIRLMCDLMVLAFQTDTTRVATFMMANAGSNRSYRHIDVPDGHHDLSHHAGNVAKLEKIRQINRFHTTQLAYLLEKLKSIPEGEGTLLDNCMVLYGSGLGDGNRHNHDNLPVLLAGRGGGTIDTGRHVVCENGTPMNNLFLSMLDRMGASVEFIGDSTEPLTNLTV